MPLLRNYVGGHWIETETRFDDINPVDGSVVAQVCEAGQAVVDKAVSAAKAALAAGWGTTTVDARARALRQIADGIERRFDAFVAAEIADTGKDATHARTIDIPRAIANFRAFADQIATAHGDCFQSTTPDGLGALNYTINKPLGVVAVISPWNLPLLLLTWKVAPALACGNAVIAKPSEETPYSATLLAEVIDEIGLPPGVFNLVHGFGPDSAGGFLSTHAGVDAVTFTGASATGSAIMRGAAQTVKPISFELGGKNASLIFADADFDEAVAGTLRSVFSNCGQVCLCTERVYVERPIFEKFVHAFKLRAEQIRVGSPYEQGVGMGPLISKEHRAKVLSYFDLAVAEGARVVTGGSVPVFGDARDQGCFVSPTIWTGLSADARCMQEEIFGPVCHIAPFDTEEDAVTAANNTQYGLATALWTTDLKRAHRLAPRMESGIVWVNTWFLRDLRTPFGGVKLSGIGREGGRHSLAFYSEPTNICIKL
ncbi:2-hydroxymuconic semialdehyde dehydrogenase [Acetobacter sp. TBRC 12305]|uniref:2-hydroxymuconic semialdehyde dehydrogenase n=1 Tax=Acetobacter garciniae TaxID=2817435 RepID=A0A939HNU1_9PROT|nr:2-hydroxymuconic semialdehyde dehydrogenase [Acetobacter garciniae]MBX0346237.1 2-hydroxymuconic semialdehyde dehydrogenase [Acetobacter garciniae]